MKAGFFPKKSVCIKMNAGVLMRGEPFRWGIDTIGLTLQKNVFISIDRCVVKELSQTYKFTYLIGVDRRRNYDDNVYDKLQEYTANTSSTYFNINTTSQVDNFRQIVARARPVIHTMHVLFVFRHDVYVKTRIHDWGCDLTSDHSIILPGYIRETRNASVNDIYQIIHRKAFAVFDSVLFTNKYKCWAIGMSGWQADTGHFCNKVFTMLNISYTTCPKTVRNKHHSPNYGTHELSHCETLLKQSKPWRCEKMYRLVNASHH